MAVVLGTNANITLLNVHIEEIAPDTAWFRCSLSPDLVSGDRANLWLPDDARISTATTVPANWPPHVGDVWRVGPTGPTAWVVDKGDGTLFFVTVNNIKNKTTPISTDQALAQFGTTLQMVTRVS